MKKLLSVITIMLCMVVVLNTAAQGAGLESKGIGTRGRGMGFAMVAIPGYWAAIHYNPACVQTDERSIFGFEYEYFTGSLESTASLRNLSVAQANPRRGDFIDFIGDEPAAFKKKSISSTIHFGALGYIFVQNNVSWGIGFYGSGSGTKWQDAIVTSSTGDTITAKVAFTNCSLNIPLAFSYRASPVLSFGATLGMYWGLLTYENQKIRIGQIPYVSKTIQDTAGVGLGVDVGALWRAKPNLNFGLVFKLPYTFRKSGDTEIEQSLSSLSAVSDTTVDMRYPLRIALGSAWRPFTRHLIACNLTWLNWDKYNLKINYKNEVPGIFKDSSSNPADWEDTIVVNLGYEWERNNRWTYRFGLTYDMAPEPEHARTLTGGQVVDAWLFSLGTGINLGKNIIDITYIYTYGPEVSGFIPDAKYSMNLHEVSIGIVKKW
ncbi:MAG: OmpP1/FadL family transporter [bacterium]